ncbi:MAG: DUF2959 family protein [Flammeovirgaceae bacterium]
MLKHQSIFLFVIIIGLVACHRGKSPEGLPKFKQEFKTQIASFEKQKERANKQVNTSLESLSALQQALQDAKNVDKEFAAVYGKWEKVNKRVKHLNKEYEDLRKKADNLFAAITRQIESLSDDKTKKQLTEALAKSREEYNETLKNTSKAIEKLRGLHAEAVDIVKSLEAAVAIGQIAQINQGLKNIESRVADIMDELSVTVKESKALYAKKMGSAS